MACVEGTCDRRVPLPYPAYTAQCANGEERGTAPNLRESLSIREGREKCNDRLRLREQCESSDSRKVGLFLRSEEPCSLCMITLHANNVLIKAETVYLV